MGALRKLAAWSKVVVGYVQTPAAGNAPDAFIFVNPLANGETYEIVSASCVYDVAGGSGAQADVKVVPAATALASGVSALASVFDLTATARTVQNKALSATKTRRLVKPGQSLAIDTGGTLTNLASMCITVELQPLTRRTQR
jgi:hypothetical protein